jgi:hypothetical protein
MGEQNILCDVPYERALQMHHISTKIEGSLSGDIVSLCTRVKKQKKYTIAVAKKDVKCSAAVKAKHAAAAGYTALVIIGGRNYDQKKESDKSRLVQYKIPVVAIDDMAWKMAKVRPGVISSLHFKVIKEEGSLQKDGGDLFAESMRMMDATRFGEAAARLYLSTVLEPNFIPGLFALTSAQYIRDCSTANCDGDGWNFHPSALPDWQRESIVKQLKPLLAGEDGELGSVESVYSEQCQDKQQLAKGGEIRLVTVSTKSRPEYTTLRDSAEASGLTLEMLGTSTTYGKSGTKLELLSEYLAEVPEEDFVIYVGTSCNCICLL